MKGLEGPQARAVKRVWLFVLAISLHNLPEGQAIGVAYAGTDPMAALALATGISIQDVLEGLVVALALRSVGYSRVTSAGLGMLSGFVEPIAAVFGAAVIGISANLLSLAHGGPLRLIVPGYTGVNSIKYIKQLAFTAQESDANIVSHGYRVTPPGGKGDPSQPSVQEMTVKSWVNSPHPESGLLREGWMQIHGVAFGGLQAVRGVEVSIDGGKTWQKARLVGPDLGKYAWLQFVLPAHFSPGRYLVTSRATDMAGNVQPEQRGENQSGYNNTSWADHAVKVTVA